MLFFCYFSTLKSNHHATRNAMKANEEFFYFVKSSQTNDDKYFYCYRRKKLARQDSSFPHHFFFIFSHFTNWMIKYERWFPSCVSRSSFDIIARRTAASSCSNKLMKKEKISFALFFTTTSTSQIWAITRLFSHDDCMRTEQIETRNTVLVLNYISFTIIITYTHTCCVYIEFFSWFMKHIHPVIISSYMIYHNFIMQNKSSGSGISQVHHMQ